MNQKTMQKMAQFIMKTTLKQCDNLTTDVLVNKLGISNIEVEELINILHKEHVVRYKYNYTCPKCEQTDTTYEDDMKKKNECSICGKLIPIEELVDGAIVRYVLDREDFKEYYDENFGNFLMISDLSKITDNINNIVLFESAKENIQSSKVMEDMQVYGEKDMKLFISHSSDDYDYVKCFIEFLEDIGMSSENVFCSSIKGYGIPWGNNIYDYLAGEFQNKQKELLVLFMLSDNYYESTACLNEMGASWILKKEYRSVLLPGFEFSQIEGAVNPNIIAIKFDDRELKYNLNDIQKQLAEIFRLPEIEVNKWDRIRDDFIKKIEKLKSA